MKKISFITAVLFLWVMFGCGFSYKFTHTDNWAGQYRLIEFNCCGDTATKVKMEMQQLNDNEYNWTIFLNEERTEQLDGKAFYSNNKMKFYVNEPDSVNKYFVKNVSKKNPVFDIGCENNFPGSCYTSWNTDLKNYKRGKMLFAGINYHFRKK